MLPQERFLFAITTAILLFLSASCQAQKSITVFPEEYPSALRNPLKGFRPDFWDYLNESKLTQDSYATLVRTYIRWSDLENSQDDDLVKNIQAYQKKRWTRFEGTGIKLIPRVYLNFGKEPGDEYWPADMQTGDYSSPQFKQRVLRLVEALGECWNDNPRVAWVQMGIIGTWGEHHSPHPTPEIQQLLGAAFEKAFPDKQVLVRHPDEFTDFEFGIYWDSWAHERQTKQLQHGLGVKILNEETGRWKARVIEGETAYDWGTFRIQPGDDPNDTLTDPIHRDFLINTIRDLHCTALGWIARYDKNNLDAASGAELVQRNFGYRFVMDSFTYSPKISMGDVLQISFKVRNTGSAPFYQDWKPKVSLLDPESLEVMWSQSLDDIDIRSWLPGDDWDEATGVYRIPAETYTAQANVSLPSYADLPIGEYIVALSIPDPEMGELGLRFAIKNYLKGDLHPVGRLAYGVKATADYAMDAALFENPMLKGR